MGEKTEFNFSEIRKKVSDFLTELQEYRNTPNSRTVIAGALIKIDDRVAHTMEIHMENPILDIGAIETLRSTYLEGDLFVWRRFGDDPTAHAYPAVSE